MLDGVFGRDKFIYFNFLWLLWWLRASTRRLRCTYTLERPGSPRHGPVLQRLFRLLGIHLNLPSRCTACLPLLIHAAIIIQNP